MCERASCHGGETNCFLPLVWTFALNAFPQPLQNLTVKLAIEGLTREYKFLVDNALDVGKNGQHGFDIAANLMCFFWPRWIWRLPLRQLLHSLRVISIHPCFITGYDIGDEVGVISGLLFEFPADRKAKGLLVVAQQPWHKSRRNASHVQIARQNGLNGPVWQFYYLTNIVDSCLQSAGIASWTFAMFSGVVLVYGHPERSSLLTDIRLSFKRLYHKKFCFGSWHYLRRLPGAFGGFLQQFFFLRLKQNLMQILCSLKSVISVVKKIHQITKT